MENLINIRNLLKNINYNFQLLTLENINNFRQKTYTNLDIISDYMLLKKVKAFTYSFISSELLIYYE